MQKSLKQAFITTTLISGVILSGCTIDPYTGEKKVSNTAKGAGIGTVAGAAIGAGIGAATGDSKDARRGALIGAGVGAAAGAGIGYYMDTQEAKLRQRLQNTGVSVTREGDQIHLNMPGNILFESNSAQLTQGFDVLSSVAAVLKEFDDNYAMVTGHTDNMGSSSYNLQLSQARAEAVKNYLISQGAPANRLLSQGVGESDPIASNNNEQGRALNRRVEITIAPTPSF